MAAVEYMKQKEAVEVLEGIEIIGDDIILCGCGGTIQETKESHDRHLMERCGKVNFKLNRKKVKLRLNDVTTFYQQKG